jgi:hypothetical protein
MSKLQQKILWCSWLWAILVLPLQAQTDSTAVAPNNSKLERLAVLEVSEAALNRKQSRRFAQALAQVCRDEFAFAVASENVIEAYLKKRRQFSIFVADSAQSLCKNLALDYLIVSSIERAEASAPSFSTTAADHSWQVTLRWIDGATGQITKIYGRECSGSFEAPNSFPLRELLSSLIESPDIIVPVENAPAEMPTIAAWPPDTTIAESPATDAAEAILSPPQKQIKRGRNWWWYVTGAALVSGGSAALLLRNPAKSASNGKILLPEPPKPPK